MAEEQMGNKVVFSKGSSPSRRRTSDTSAQYNTRQPLILFFVVLLPFNGTAAQQTSTTCDMTCSYVEAYRQANCENLHIEGVPVECNDAQYLSLRNNLITHIEPGSFRGFFSLKSLILSFNNILKIDDNTFVGASNLTSIILRFNHIYDVSRYAFNGTENKLQNIYLNVNYISVIETGTFQHIPYLETLDLYSNHISFLTPDVFRDLKNLKFLYLGKNKLVDLPDNVFKGLSSLVSLDISNNSISLIKLYLFETLPNLKQINLSGNRLVAIGNTLSLPNIILDLRWNYLYHLGSALPEDPMNFSIGTLYLERNPWACNCSLERFRSGCLNAHPYCNISDKPVCKSPKNMIGYPLKGLNETLCNHNTKPMATMATNKIEKSMNETTVAANKIKKETNAWNYNYKAAIIILIPVIICALLLGVRLYRRNISALTNHLSGMSENENSCTKSKSRQEGEWTPDKCTPQAQEPPKPPTKSLEDGTENGSEMYCKRKLFLSSAE